ncbi:MAG: ABC transporter substrate-binding protein [Armatimonadota bacterium]|nr:ABC transporter substrate-binding protein [Armatimonadota bacterium]
MACRRSEELKRRDFITGALCAGASYALFGCGRRGASGKIPLTFNTFWTDRDAHATTMNWIYKEFRRKYPEYDFQDTQVSGGAQDNGQKLMAELAAGGGPDILADITYNQVRAGYCLDLTEHIETWRDRFYPEALESCTWDGHVYSLPTEYSYVPCIWNMATLDAVGKKLPATFDEYMDLGDALRKKNIHLTSIVVAGHNIFFTILFSHKDVLEIIAKQEWGAEPFRNTIRVIKQLLDAGFLPPNDIENQWGQGAALFQQDRLAHYMNGAWTIINEITAEGVDPTLRDRIEFAPFPEINGVRPIRAWVATKAAINQKLSRDKAKLKGALAFWDLVTSKEAAKRFVSMAHSPEGVKIEVTKEMAGPLLYGHIKSRDMATKVFDLPNKPTFFSEKLYLRALPNLFATILEGASLNKALKVFAEEMNT